MLVSCGGNGRFRRIKNLRWGMRQNRFNLLVCCSQNRAPGARVVVRRIYVIRVLRAGDQGGSGIWLSDRKQSVHPLPGTCTVADTGFYGNGGVIEGPPEEGLQGVGQEAQGEHPGVQDLAGDLPDIGTFAVDDGGVGRLARYRW